MFPGSIEPNLLNRLQIVDFIFVYLLADAHKHDVVKLEFEGLCLELALEGVEGVYLMSIYCESARG